MTTRIYRIGDRLIRAKSRLEARAHVARELVVALASQDDMFELATKGATIEDASVDPNQAELQMEAA